MSAGPSYQIIDPEGNILASGGTGLSETKSSKKYSSSSNLGKNYRNQVNSLRKSFAGEVSSSILGQTRAALAKKFDFKKTSDQSQLYIIVKYDTDKEYEKYYKQIDEEWKEMDAGTPSAEFREKFADALAFYEKEAQIEPKGDKKLARVFEAANYNYALLNFYLDDFETAVRYANRVIAQQGGKHKRASDLIKKIQSVKEQMDLHDIETMHYVRDLTDAMAPAKLKAIEMAQEEMEEENDMKDGTITIKGKEVKGKFVTDKGATALDFSENGNTYFMAEVDGKEAEYTVATEDISAFTIGDRSFVKTNFAPCSKGKSEPAVHIMEEVYKSDRITLYKYYPVGGALSDEKQEFAFKKASEESPISLYDTQFLILKLFKKSPQKRG